ncbi:hypothetical protein [Actinoallomurus acaciae]|uniref:Uncharacterized protein n=1 Tax=Actinoallomurus acaciae TaxID=502577 RepID=A0ABV5Z2T7_9ACTN
METEGRRDDEAPEEQEQEKQHDHVRAASELSDRAAESVSRRYDGTKEAHHETRDDDADEEDSAG